MSMELVRQPTPETCGQACIAMITGKGIGAVIRDMKTDGPTCIGQMVEILDAYGVRRARRNLRVSKKNPAPAPYSILTVHTDCGYPHWVLFYGGKYYDPEFGIIEGEYPHGRITSFLEIVEEA